MNSHQLKNLREAYMNIYEEVDARRAPKEMLDRLNSSREGWMVKDGPNRPAYDAKQRILAKTARKRNKKINEEVDFYYLIISYLLDESYAETLESAEIIFENMSDEWIDDVLEAYVDPEHGEAPSGRSPLENVSYLKSKKKRKRGVEALRKSMEREYGGKWRAKHSDPIEEGRIPWDDPNRPLRSGWTPREKNRAKRISIGVETPENIPTEKELEKYGRLKNAQDTMRNIKVKAKDRHKDKSDYGLGRHNVFLKEPPRLPSETRKGDRDSGLHRVPRNSILGTSRGTDVERRKAYDELGSDKYGAKNDEARDKYYEKGPKGLKEPK